MFKAWMNRFSLTFALLILSGMCGCMGGAAAPPEKELIPVTGSVTLDGKPLAGATINFTPSGATGGVGGFAVTDADGKFEASDYSYQPGLEAGTYEITFSKMALPDGSPIPEGKDAADVGATQQLPPHLSASTAGSAYQFLTVEKGPVTVDYELKSKR